MRDRRFGTIIQIGDILVSEEVVLEYFACDYAACKGCCCIIGDSGAPLAEEEIGPIERNYPVFAPLMQESGRAVVADKGFFDIDRDGDLVTPVVPGKEECAYTHFNPDGSCLCAMEKAWFAGTCDFRKPLSCQLYPIRVTDMPGGGKALNLHRWDICRDAYAKGRKEKVRVYEFLREPLVRAFGEDFYSALSAAAKRLIASA